jgi:hypothetical protein
MLCKRRYIFCARRNIYCARRKSHLKEDIYLLQKINHLLQKNKFICNRRNSSFTTSPAAEDSFFGCMYIFEHSTKFVLNIRSYALKKPCRGFYVSQNILPTTFEIDQIQNIIHIGKNLLIFKKRHSRER